VWYSLIYYPLSSGGNSRFGGLKEQQQLAFEAGEPWFPGDFPGTRAGWEWSLNDAEKARQEWERRPKGRRPEFDSLDLGDGQKGEIGRGWACDWERLVQGPPKDVQAADSKSEKQSIKKPDGNKGSDGDTSQDCYPPLNIRQLRKNEAEITINNPSSTTSEHSLATVRISLFSRGTPTPRARIYRLPSTNVELRQKWLSLSTANRPKAKGFQQNTLAQKEPTSFQEEARQRLAASLISPSNQDSPEYLSLPSEADLIGFVTTGNYNLSEGQGTGIGSILVSKVAGSGGAQGKGKAGERNMCIIRAAGERVGRLGFWELV
jgi:ribonuclease P/MRP protein subunit POP1